MKPRVINFLRALISIYTQKKNYFDSNHEFHPGYLEVTDCPPNPLARKIALGITSTFLLALLWSVIGKLDIQANATGQLLVPSHSKIIQPLETSEVLDIHVQDGQWVKKGEILISLNPINADVELHDLTSQLRYDQLEIARLSAQLTSSPLENFIAPKGALLEDIEQTRKHLENIVTETSQHITSFDAELNVNLANQEANRGDIQSLNRLINNILVRVRARQSLVASHIVSKVELLEHEKEQLDTERELAQKKNEQAILVAEYKKIEEEKADYLAQRRREDNDQLVKLQNETERVQQQLIKAKDHARQQTLRSPVNGIVQQLSVHTKGGVVQPAQQLMVVVPDNASREAEVMVLNKDIGFIKAGQSAELKIDAFPYTRYGTVHGIVTSVSHDAVKDEKLGMIFPAKIKLDSVTMDIDGKKIQLQAGMSTTADIRTGERRIIDYLLSPLEQYKSEAMRER